MLTFLVIFSLIIQKKKRESDSNVTDSGFKPRHNNHGSNEAYVSLSLSLSFSLFLYVSLLLPLSFSLSLPSFFCLVLFLCLPVCLCVNLLLLSYGGGTVTIHGSGFSEDVFNQFDPILGNKVKFVNKSAFHKSAVIDK